MTTTCSAELQVNNRAVARVERVSEIVLRNEQRLNSGDLLLVNPPRDSAHRLLAANGRRLRIFTQDFGDSCWLKSGCSDVEFGVIPEVIQPFAQIVLVQPKERARLHMILHAINAGMSPTASLWLVGENRSGIKSSGKHLGQYFKQVTKTDSARHCSLFEATMPRASTPFTLSHYEKTWSIPNPGGPINLASLPGLFSHGRLDPGTRLLLDCLQEMSITGRVLDFACGSGVIGLSLLNLNPVIELTLLDTSALALESTRRSLLLNRRKATVVASDGLSRLSGSFDWIISNPPFHRGVGNDLGIVQKFCEEAGHFLTRTGKILLVCNHHLPYAGWLKHHFSEIDTIKSNREYKVIQASGYR